MQPNRMKGRGAAGLAVGLAMTLSLQAGAAPAVFSESGLTGIRVDAADLPVVGGLRVTRVVTSDRLRDRGREAQGPHPAPAAAADDREFTDASVAPAGPPVFEADTHTLSQPFDWGEVTVRYTVQSDRIDFAVAVRNRSDRVIERLDLDLLELALPSSATVDSVSATVSGRNRSGCNLGGPDLWRGRYGDRQLLWLSLQPDRPLRQRIEPAADHVRLTVSAGQARGGAEVYDGAWDARPIAPGGQDRYALSLRFAPAGTDPHAVAADVFTAFGEAVPAAFHWPDRRPVGEVHIGDTRRDGRNPRGWFFANHDARFPAATDAGFMEAFAEAMQAHARRLIESARLQGVQGVIIWQVEGMQEPGHAYYGDPRILPYVAPEMDAVADAYFRTLREAGLRVGVTIRPVIQIPFDPEVGSHAGEVAGVVGWDAMREAALRADWSVQFRSVDWLPAIPEQLLDVFDPEEAWCPVTRLDNKIRYARERWDATVFYLDANLFNRPRDASASDGGWRRLLMSAAQVRALRERHPDVLIISEWQSLDYWADSAQYTGPAPRGASGHPGHFETGPDVRLAYPEGMTVFSGPNVFRLAEPGRHARSVRTVMEGDSSLVDPVNTSLEPMVRAVFGVAAMLAPFHVVVRSDGIAVNDHDLTDADALRAYLAGALGGKPLPRRRVFVRYTDEITPAALQRVLDAVTAAGGIVAWTQPDDVTWRGRWDFGQDFHRGAQPRGPETGQPFWHPDNPVRALTPRTHALVFHAEDGVRVCLANAADTPQVADYAIDVDGLGLGAAGDLTIVPLAGLLAAETEDGNAGADAHALAFDDGILRIPLPAAALRTVLIKP